MLSPWSLQRLNVIPPFCSVLLLLHVQTSNRRLTGTSRPKTMAPPAKIWTKGSDFLERAKDLFGKKRA